MQFLVNKLARIEEKSDLSNNGKRVIAYLLTQMLFSLKNNHVNLNTHRHTCTRQEKGIIRAEIKYNIENRTKHSKFSLPLLHGLVLLCMK